MMGDPLSSMTYTLEFVLVKIFKRKSLQTYLEIGPHCHRQRTDTEDAEHAPVCFDFILLSENLSIILVLILSEIYHVNKD